MVASTLGGWGGSWTPGPVLAQLAVDVPATLCAQCSRKPQYNPAWPSSRLPWLAGGGRGVRPLQGAHPSDRGQGHAGEGCTPSPARLSPRRLCPPPWPPWWSAFAAGQVLKHWCLPPCWHGPGSAPLLTPPPPPPRLPSRLQALRKPWRMQLVRELSFGHRVTPGSLSEWQAAHEQALREGVFLN